MSNLPSGTTVIYTDGSCDGNPGPAGADLHASTLKQNPEQKSPAIRPLLHAGIPLSNQSTNNFGELYALGAAAALMVDVIEGKNPQEGKEHYNLYTKLSPERDKTARILSIHVFTDSLLTANIIAGVRKAKKNKKLVTWMLKQNAELGGAELNSEYTG